MSLVLWSQVVATHPVFVDTVRRWGALQDTRAAIGAAYVRGCMQGTRITDKYEYHEIHWCSDYLQTKEQEIWDDAVRIILRD